MARLPVPGSDKGQWGGILNEYLAQSHNDDGSLKSGAVGASQLQSNSVTTDTVVDRQITTTKIALGAVTSEVIDSGAVLTEKLADGAVSELKLAAPLQAKLNMGVAEGSISTEMLADSAVTPDKINGLGASNGIASLDSNGIIRDTQLPARLSDVELKAMFIGEGAPVFHAAKSGIVSGSASTALANSAALLALLSIVPSGSIIQFPVGVIYFTNITVDAGKIIHLRGAGRNVTTLRRPAGVTGDFITINAASSTLSDLTVEGGRYQNTGNSGMDNIVVNAAYVTLQRLGVNKATGSGIVLGKAGPAIVGFYSDLQFRENLHYHIRTISGSDSTDGMWVNIEGGFSGRSGIRLDTGSQNMINVHMWASGMEDIADNHGIWVNSTNNTLNSLQCETNTGEGIYVTGSRNVFSAVRSWGNMKRGLFLTGMGNSFTGGTFERNCITNTVGSISDAFAQIVLSGANRSSLVGINVIDLTTTINSADPSSRGSPAATYPHPGKSAAVLTASYALREESGADYNNFTGCQFREEYTLGGSTPPYSFASGVGNNDSFSAVDFGAVPVPIQTVVSGTVRIPSYSDVIQVNAGSSITNIVGQKTGRRATIIFIGTGTGSVTGNGSTLNLASNFNPIPGNTLSLISDGTNWYETARSS